MANEFKRFLARGVGGAQANTIFTANNSIASVTLIGLTITNKINNTVEVDAYINDGSTDTYIVYNVPIPAGSTVVPVGGNQKIVLEPGDSLVVSANTQNVDAVASMLIN